MRAMARGQADPLRRRAVWPRVLLFVLVATGTALAFREGLVAPSLSPLPEIDLARPRGWLLDWRLAGLKHYPSVCARALNSPRIDAAPIADSPIKDGCGWSNGVRLAAAGGARASFDKITCEMAVALALWMEHEVQPLALEHLGERVTSLLSRGSYACRNIVGNAVWRHVRSQHAYANAADIAGFTLADGRQIDILTHWSGETPEGRFLRQAHARACRYFRAALGPAYNAAHRNHFHLDRGPFSSCR
jgi:hypothetical protein